jgi:hypothetical protein
MSPASKASAKRPTISRSHLEFGSGGRSRPAAGRRVSNAARAAQQAVDGWLGRIEHFGDLAGAEPEHITRHEHCALLWREARKADDEGKRDRFSGFVARLGSGSFVRDAL